MRLKGWRVSKGGLEVVRGFKLGSAGVGVVIVVGVQCRSSVLWPGRSTGLGKGIENACTGMDMSGRC
jgi:hypothetical protein